jgi:hypothetical protein
VVIPILCRRVFNSKLLSLAISRQNPPTQPSKNLNTRTTPSLTKNQEPPIISKTSQKNKTLDAVGIEPTTFHRHCGDAKRTAGDVRCVGQIVMEKSYNHTPS